MPGHEIRVGKQAVRESRTETSGRYSHFGNAEIVSVQIPYECVFAGLVHAIERLEDAEVIGLMVDLATLLRQAGEPEGFRISIHGRTPFYEEVVRGIIFQQLPGYLHTSLADTSGLSRWGLIVRSPHFPGGLQQLETVAFEPMDDSMEELVAVTLPNRLIRRMPDFQVYEAAWNIQEVLSRHMGFQ